MRSERLRRFMGTIEPLFTFTSGLRAASKSSCASVQATLAPKEALSHFELMQHMQFEDVRVVLTYSQRRGTWGDRVKHVGATDSECFMSVATPPALFTRFEQSKHIYCSS